MRSKIIILPFILLLIVSCGNNKREFQKVYDYYSKPEDSLKLKAAEFLIKNIRNHSFSVLTEEEKVDDFFKSLGKEIVVPYMDNVELRYELKQNLVDDFISKGLKNGSLPPPTYQKRRKDLEAIKSEFLIENIEYAFKAWKFPWARKYSFNDFCKYILPYRYGNEPLEPWRKELFEKYKWIADSLPNGNTLEATILINKQFQKDFITSKVLGKKGYRIKISNQLDAGIFVDCYDQAGLGVSVLRALGIPSTVVRIPKWGNRNSGHDMTGIINLNNEWIDFNFAGLNHDPLSKNLVRAPKIYFKHFDEYEDATSKSIKTINLEVKVNANEKDVIYLCVFDNLSWVPVFKGKNLKSKVIFEDVGNNTEVMFLAAVKSEGKLKPVSSVFLKDSLGNVKYYKPTSKKHTTSLNRKYPGSKKGLSRLNTLIGGEFSIADSKDFLNKKQLFKIDTILEYRNNIIKVPEQKGKYVRYDFPSSLESNFDGPAEISFYTTNQGKLEKIKGKYFGSPQLSQEHIKIMTDNDVLNYVEVWDYKKDVEFETDLYILRKDKQPIWFGMEMDSVTTVTHIGICPRNDKNGVYPGMNYELFYWDYAWVSLGAKKANSNSISYEGIPENALLWLRNLDEGKEERIFTLVDGEQVWW